MPGCGEDVIREFQLADGFRPARVRAADECRKHNSRNSPLASASGSPSQTTALGRRAGRLPASNMCHRRTVTSLLMRPESAASVPRTAIEKRSGNVRSKGLAATARFGSPHGVVAAPDHADVAQSAKPPGDVGLLARIADEGAVSRVELMVARRSDHQSAGEINEVRE